MPSPIEENKVLIRRFFTAIESGDLRVFDEIVAEDYDDHLAVQSPGTETLNQYFTGLRSAFPDLQLPISALLADAPPSPFLIPLPAPPNADFLRLTPPSRNS